jgi:hypothetical protein
VQEGECLPRRVKGARPLSPAETARLERLRGHVKALGRFQWTCKGLARTWGYESGTSVRDRMAGDVRITDDEEEWLERWAAFAEANPPPYQGVLPGNARRRGPESPDQK